MGGGVELFPGKIELVHGEETRGGFELQLCQESRTSSCETG